jgi:hypothetical protein
MIKLGVSLFHWLGSLSERRAGLVDFGICAIIISSKQQCTIKEREEMFIPLVELLWIKAC